MLRIAETALLTIKNYGYDMLALIITTVDNCQIAIGRNFSGNCGNFSFNSHNIARGYGRRTHGNVFFSPTRSTSRSTVRFNVYAGIVAVSARPSKSNFPLGSRLPEGTYRPGHQNERRIALHKMPNTCVSGQAKRGPVSLLAMLDRLVMCPAFR